MLKTLLFSNILYMYVSIQIFVTFNIYYFCENLDEKLKICAVKIVHFIHINMTLVVIFMIFLKQKFVCIL
jgi:hypothetical protein